MKAAASIVAAMLLSGCATFGFRLDGARLNDLIADGRSRGIWVEDPLEMDDAMREAARVQVGGQGTDLEKARRLNAWLRGRSTDQLGFTYDAAATRTAKEAFHARSGDCLSYAHLFNAMARYLGVSVGYVRYREAQSYDERNGQFTVVSHVASVFNDFRMTIFIELNGVPESSRTSDYQPIGDDEAAALHLSNLAMDAFSHGERELPQRTLKWLVERTPRLPEVHNNLAAVLLRLGKARPAMDVLQPAMDRFPDFVPLYVNAALAAQRLGDEAKSEELAEKARSSDPFLPFVRGTWLLEKGKYEAAEQLISRARKMRPDSVTFTAWLAQAKLMSGKKQEAREMFAEARKLSPGHPLLAELEKKHPELVGP
ncbi:MAG: tetratricopeptide repeat protein [Archangiaceae bacterium]|nr:tetratricopeptide repeat protein [Archangiaceae bacterium]